MCSVSGRGCYATGSDDLREMSPGHTRHCDLRINVFANGAGGVSLDHTCEARRQSTVQRHTGSGHTSHDAFSKELLAFRSPN